MPTQEAKRPFYEMLKQGKTMIRSEAGLEQLDKLFASITEAKHDSDLVQYARDLERERKGKGGR